MAPMRRKHGITQACVSFVCNLAFHGVTCWLQSSPYGRAPGRFLQYEIKGFSKLKVLNSVLSHGLINTVCCVLDENCGGKKKKINERDDFVPHHGTNSLGLLWTQTSS